MSTLAKGSGRRKRLREHCLPDLVGVDGVVDK